MDPIDTLTKLMETLARQRSPGQERVTRTEVRTRSGVAGPRTPTKTGVAQLQRRISERLQGLDPLDGNQYQRAVHVFFESVLTWEFGEKLIQDAHFTDVVREVESRMLSDPELSDGLAKLLQQMMKR